MSSLRTPEDKPKKYAEGERVRIFLGYSTDTEVHVREGEILAHKKNRVWGGPDHLGRSGDALVLLVEKTGDLLRGSPYEISVRHSATGHLVSGHLSMRRTKKQYVGVYFYDRISGAERV
jgi:hypothetical protein